MTVVEQIAHSADRKQGPLVSRTGNASSFEGDLIFVIGAPRSGTTWLAKMFDSHPDVLYRHEPDTVVRHDLLPTVCPREQISIHRQLARDYLARLRDTCTLKTAATLPLFAKNYRRGPRQWLHKCLVYALRAAAAIGAGGQHFEQIALPDLIGRSSPLTVVKSVSSLGRAGLFATALPSICFVHILRHPCGQVASMMRGIKLGKFHTKLRMEELLAVEGARQHRLTLAKMEAMPVSDQLAWRWALLNQKAVDDLKDAPRCHMLCYEDLCERPIAVAQNMFSRVGLSWNDQTAAFIKKSATYKGPDRYYQILKDSVAAANKWRSDLSAQEKARIAAIVRQFPIGEAYF